MGMADLTQSQREHVADFSKDSANVILAALIIGGAIEKGVGWPMVAAGFVIFFSLFFYSTAMRKRR
jgi:hypothetical protein